MTTDREDPKLTRREKLVLLKKWASVPGRIGGSPRASKNWLLHGAPQVQMVLMDRLDELWLVHLEFVWVREHDDRVLPLERIQEFPQLVVCWPRVSPVQSTIASNTDIPLSANTSALFAVSLTRGRCASSTF